MSIRNQKRQQGYAQNTAHHTTTKQMVIKPDIRQYLTEVMPLILVGLLGMALYPCIPKWTYVTYAYLALYAILIITLSTRYAVLRAFSWEISDVKICRKHGILTRQTDYIELYRVVDYRETQSFLQRLFGVKTVVIISTDKSDPAMLIRGVPVKTDLVNYTRTLVEQNKKENHIYEITNR